ncbi:MAG: tRNA (adenosine(37)-N6)-threonylcarbamoyltransferase complex dimerization subunit type 1 TsaB [Steroidobacteraceae bacterium]|nr:tRNA (adenosine(37)-N6)-threonylcarbamoyltransferase complex dimerization subunit type 1 TsaB [Steroidobacteraceae bacterium]
MKILAIDTATEACSAALLIENRLITREREFERGHAEHILPMVDEVLAEAGLSLAATDALAFGRGPGGFTGVRLAASVAQGLAFAAGLRVVPVSDLAAVAQQAFDRDSTVSRVVVCNDARMREVYWACFERGEDGLAAPVGPEHVSPPASVALPAQWTGAVAGTQAVGRGFRAYPELRQAFESRVQGFHDTLLPRAAEIARLAVRDVRAGRLCAPEDAIPVYLRDDVARPPAQ